MTGGEDMGGLDPELEAILAKDDTAIMLDELRELFGADIDGDSRFTVAQIMTAMERSFENGKAHIQMVHEAERRAAVHAPPSLSPGVGCEHTPGPWLTELQGEGARGHWLHDGEEDYVALACRRVSRSEEDANARLIAAAPDMFEALERLLDQRKAGFFTEYAWEAARAAIARAKGDRA